MIYQVMKNTDGTAKAVPVTRPDRSFKMVYGLPTTGKTHLEKLLIELGLSVLDTDSILRRHFPEWGELRIYTKKKWDDKDRALNSFLNVGVGSLTGIHLEKKDGIVLTNMLSKGFYSILASLSPGHGLIGFTREKSDLEYLWTYRFPDYAKKSDVDHWNLSLDSYVRTFPNEAFVVQLPKGTYLLDYINVSEGTVDFVSLGLKEMGMEEEAKEAAMKGSDFFQTRWFLAEFCEYLVERTKSIATPQSRAMELIDTLGCLARFPITVDLGKYNFDQSVILKVVPTLRQRDKIVAALHEYYEPWATKQASRGREVISIDQLADAAGKFSEQIVKSFTID